MTDMQLAMTVVVSLAIPWAVQLIKTEAMRGEAARWTAFALCLVAGAITGIAGGIPATPEAWLTCIFAVVGGVQVAYTAFKSVGITSRWLDALLAIGNRTEQQ